MEEKHFGEWINLKEKIHFGNSAPRINEGDVWWCGTDLDIVKEAFHELYK